MSSLFNLSPKQRDGSAAVHSFNRVLVSEILYALKDQGLSRSELADRLGVDKASITRLLKGNSNPTARTIGEVLGALGASPELIVRRHYEQGDRNNTPPPIDPILWSSAESIKAQPANPRVIEKAVLYG